MTYRNSGKRYFYISTISTENNIGLYNIRNILNQTAPNKRSANSSSSAIVLSRGTRPSLASAFDFFLENFLRFFLGSTSSSSSPSSSLKYKNQCSISTKLKILRFPLDVLGPKLTPPLPAEWVVHTMINTLLSK